MDAALTGLRPKRALPNRSSPSNLGKAEATPSQSLTPGIYGFSGACCRLSFLLLSNWAWQFMTKPPLASSASVCGRSICFFSTTPIGFTRATRPWSLGRPLHRPDPGSLQLFAVLISKICSNSERTKPSDRSPLLLGMEGSRTSAGGAAHPRVPASQPILDPALSRLLLRNLVQIATVWRYY